MITIEKAGELCKAIYGNITPGVFDKVFTADQITVGIALVGDTFTVTFAGSETAFDWIRDFIPVPYDHPQLGTVHQGFWDGMDGVWLEVSPLLGQGKLSIQGHSLGSAHAAIFAGMCCVNKVSVDQVVLFAPPRPGYHQLKSIVQAGCKYVLAFANGIDPVPEVPIPLPDQPWCHVANLTSIFERPDGVDSLIPHKWHNIDLYQRGTLNFKNCEGN